MRSRLIWPALLGLAAAALLAAGAAQSASRTKQTPVHSANSPFLFEPWFVGPAKPKPNGTALLHAELNATDYFPAATGNGIPIVKVSIVLPPGGHFVKAWVKLVGRTRYDKPLAKTNAKVNKFRDKKGRWHLIWKYHNLILRPIPTLFARVAVPQKKGFCVKAVATAYRAGRDPVGAVAKPMKAEVCLNSGL